MADSRLSVLYQKWLPPIALGAIIVWSALLYRFGWYPPIGVYIAVVGVVAFVVTIWPPENRWSKGAWLLVVLVLCLFEIHNLYHDRDNHDATERQARKEEREAFKGIADGLTAAISANQKNFDATMQSMNRIAGTTTENLTRMTGGNSYMYFDPGGAWYEPTGTEFLLTPKFVGKYPLRDVRIRVVGSDGMEVNLDYGPFGPMELEGGKLRTNPRLRIKNNRDWENYGININASNGTVSEIIKCHRVGTKWLAAMRVWRVRIHPPNEILKTSIEPGFPTDPKGEVDWVKFE